MEIVNKEAFCHFGFMQDEKHDCWGKNSSNILLPVIDWWQSHGQHLYVQILEIHCCCFEHVSCDSDNKKSSLALQHLPLVLLTSLCINVVLSCLVSSSTEEIIWIKVDVKLLISEVICLLRILFEYNLITFMILNNLTHSLIMLTWSCCIIHNYLINSL